MFSSIVVRSSIVGLLVGSFTATVGAVAILASTPQPATAVTASEVTVAAKDYDLDYANSPMPDLSVTFGQTRDLVKQGVTISWEGATYPSLPPAGIEGGRNYLQVFQCWGEDPQRPGHPDRETCQYGATLGAAATRDGSVTTEYVHPNDLPFSLPQQGITRPPYASIPFRAVTGETLSSVNIGANGSPVRTDDDVNTNQFFTRFTTNEVSWVGTGSSGENSINFEIQTVSEAPGLGCGTARREGAVVQSVQDCWLVVLPRGTADNGESSIIRSGLFWDSWQHHIAVKIEFRPVGVRCEIGAAEKAIAGSELMTQAIASWQPQLCLQENGAAFVINTGSDADAAFKAAKTTSNPLAMTSRPLADTASDPNVYAPIGVAGAAIAFNIDRSVNPFNELPPGVLGRDATPFTEMKLTPRLVAKLLTASYIRSLPSGADLSYMGYKGVDDPGDNALNLTNDPDFLQWNDPEWRYQLINGTAVADALMPTGRSDLAWAIWSYVVADAKAREFLDGVPDEWGMRVNPWYSTNPSVNPTGVGKVYPRDDFPKSDPVERPSTLLSDPVGGVGALNLVAFRPYTTDFETGAYYTLRSDGLVVGPWQGGVSQRWGKETRNAIGTRKVIALTTTGSAAKYSTVTASLLNPAGQFVAPSVASLSAAVTAMTLTENSAVVGLDLGSAAAKSATTGYPLTMPVYAAINPLMDDAPLRAVYADFIRFAAQSGQTPGPELGQLPDGYAPIPPSWAVQAMNAASVIQAGIKPAAPVNLGSLAPGSYGQAASNPVVQNTTVDGTGDPAILVSETTDADPTIGALAGIVPLSLLTGVASGCAVPVFTRARKRLNL